MKPITVIITALLAMIAIAIVGATFQLTQAQPPRPPGAFRMMQAIENTWAAIAFEVKVDNKTLEKIRPLFQKAWDDRKKLIRESAGNFDAMMDGMAKIKKDLDKKLRKALTKEEMRKLIEWEKLQQRRPPRR
ncbi:hypothetical protein J7M22_09925 [Candidatus Poribacteria bacterium]|nr:hypothetical protein [Candidatus Poribacteria bacterium]